MDWLSLSEFVSQLNSLEDQGVIPPACIAELRQSPAFGLIERRRTWASFCKQKNKSRALLDLLRTCRDMESADIRDKVYGLLGLLDTLPYEDGDESLTADYTKSVQSVFADALRLFYDWLPPDSVQDHDLKKDFVSTLQTVLKTRPLKVVLDLKVNGLLKISILTDHYERVVHLREDFVPVISMFKEFDQLTMLTNDSPLVDSSQQPDLSMPFPDTEEKEDLIKSLDSWLLLHTNWISWKRTLAQLNLTPSNLFTREAALVKDLGSRLVYHLHQVKPSPKECSLWTQKGRLRKNTMTVASRIVDRITNIERPKGSIIYDKQAIANALGSQIMEFTKLFSSQFETDTSQPWALFLSVWKDKLVENLGSHQLRVLKLNELALMDTLLEREATLASKLKQHNLSLLNALVRYDKRVIGALDQRGQVLARALIKGETTIEDLPSQGAIILRDLMLQEKGVGHSAFIQQLIEEERRIKEFEPLEGWIGIRKLSQTEEKWLCWGSRPDGNEEMALFAMRALYLNAIKGLHLLDAAGDVPFARGHTIKSRHKR